MYTCMHMQIYRCMYEWYVYVCISLFIYIYLHILYLYTCLFTHIHNYIYIFTHAHTYIHLSIYTYIYSNIEFEEQYLEYIQSCHLALLNSLRLSWKETCLTNCRYSIQWICVCKWETRPILWYLMCMYMCIVLYCIVLSCNIT